MAKTIYKYPLVIDDEQTIDLPFEAKVIHVGYDPAGTLCVWAEVNPNNPPQPHVFYVRGTGHPFTGQEGQHIGSVVDSLNFLVWHIYNGSL